MIWAKIVGDLGQIRNNLGHRFGPKNTKFRAKNVYLPISAAQKNGFKVLVLQMYLVFYA